MALYSTWWVAALAISALTLVALVVTIIFVLQLFRLGRDRKLIEAAERSERVDLQYLMKRYVPLELRTERLGDEIPIARDQIGRSIAHRKANCSIVLVMIVLLVISGVLVLRRDILTAPSPQAEAELPLDAFSLLPGVWGWKYDFELSCSRNAHRIIVSDQRDRITVAFKQPLWDRGNLVQSWQYIVLGQQKRGLDLTPVVPEDRPAASLGDFVPLPSDKDTRWEFTLDDKDTYHVRKNDLPTTVVGPIVRCPQNKNGEK
jgi:hypothetical protein